MILGALLVYQNRSAIFVRAVNQDAKKAISFAPFVTLGLLILYLALIPLLGYIVASTLYIFCQIIVLNRGNKQRYVQYALISIVCSAIIYLLFVKVFTVMIPSGILG